MQMPYFVKRLMNYYHKRGIWKTLLRFLEEPYQIIFKSNVALIYAELNEVNDSVLTLPPGIIIECKKTYSEANQPNMQKVIDYWINDDMMDKVKERFSKGAVLWILKLNGDIAGFTWSISGKTISPWYLPLTPHDVYIFDVLTFEQYRGQGLHPLLWNFLLRKLKMEGTSRAVAEIFTWNKSSLRVLEKSNYRKFSEVRRFRVFGRNITIWSL